MSRPHNEQQPGGAAWRRRGWVIAVAVVGGGVLVGMVVPPAFRTSSKGTPVILRTTRAEQMVTAPQVSFAGVVWRDYHGILLPYSPQDGPRDTGGDLAAGFARTPRGALLAAVHIAVRASMQWGTKVFEPTIEQQVIGPDTDVLRDSTRDAYEQHRGDRKDGEPLGRGYGVLEGFRWLGYTPEAASLDLLSAGPGDSDVTVRAVTRLQLRWQDGDWRVVAPPGGTWAGTAAPIKSLDGYVRFPSGSG
ncbi:hypothetical protein [Actinomadura latina]|uniref:DUF8175 domain-containing protein n=1 Tax=Actinomadura latina TaxID=163603 RepID=A0A846YUC5_9ACTN|nr:hypothetical protein [Actinomadura latina]NKZ03327.1 hypothetical protein [Actinomadura latina]